MAIRFDNSVGVKRLLDFYIEQKYTDKIVIVTHPEDAVDIYWDVLDIFVIDKQGELRDFVIEVAADCWGLNETNVSQDILDDLVDCLEDCHGGVNIYKNGEFQDVIVEQREGKTILLLSPHVEENDEFEEEFPDF